LLVVIINKAKQIPLLVMW